MCKKYDIFENWSKQKVEKTATYHALETKKKPAKSYARFFTFWINEKDRDKRKLLIFEFCLAKMGINPKNSKIFKKIQFC